MCGALAKTWFLGAVGVDCVFLLHLVMAWGSCASALGCVSFIPAWSGMLVPYFLMRRMDYLGVIWCFGVSADSDGRPVTHVSGVG